MRRSRVMKQSQEKEKSYMIRDEILYYDKGNGNISSTTK
jgi:hypothetical protein